MMRTLLVRGMLAGLIAGVLAFAFAYLFGEPSVNSAIGFEEAMHPADGPELVPRDIQSTLGLLTGVIVYGVAIGGLFSLAFAFVYGRIGQLRPRITSLLLTAGAFIVVVAVPFLKYPANPPSVGQPGTIGERTELYFGFVAISLLAGILATAFGRKLVDRFGTWNGGLLACAGYVVVVAVAAWLLPIVNEVPPTFPATTLWGFRMASLGTQVTMWLSLGLIFGALAEKVLNKETVAV